MVGGRSGGDEVMNAVTNEVRGSFAGEWRSRVREVCGVFTVHVGVVVGEFGADKGGVHLPVVVISPPGLGIDNQVEISGTHTVGKQARPLDLIGTEEGVRRQSG